MAVDRLSGQQHWSSRCLETNSYTHHYLHPCHFPLQQLNQFHSKSLQPSLQNNGIRVGKYNKLGGREEGGWLLLLQLQPTTATTVVCGCLREDRTYEGMARVAMASACCCCYHYNPNKEQRRGVYCSRRGRRGVEEETEKESTAASDPLELR